MMTILFIGSNPSNASTCDIAFHASTKSSKVLTEWSKDLPGCKMHTNVVTAKTEGNRPLKMSEIKSGLVSLKERIDAIKPDKIVALGKTAAKAVTLLHLDFFEMPHPSGCNRLLNDPVYVEEKKKALRNYVLGPSSESNLEA